MTTHSSNGSVLMETILVLPLLLLLFGGIFMVGDILHGRLHLLTIDRVAAWTPESRFETGRKDIFTSWFRHLRWHTALDLEHAYADWYYTGSPPSKSGPTGTGWLDFVGGRAYSKVEVPMWVAMANVHNVLYRRPGKEYLSAEWRLHVYEADVDKDSVDGKCHAAGEYQAFNREYVLRRRPESMVDADFCRTASTLDLDWYGITFDSWPSTDHSALDGSFLFGLEKKLRRPFMRHPAAMAVGE